MKLTHILMLIALAVVSGITTLHFAADMPGMIAPAGTAETKKETAYERVMRTGTIRCGYGIWSGLFEKDANTGALSGPAYDYTMALAEKLNLRVEWSEEIGWADAVPAIINGRIDAFCSMLWANSARAPQVDFGAPIYFNALYAYVRADDKRFDNNVMLANGPDTRIVSLDGSTEGLIQKQDFPKATVVSMGQLTSNAELFEVVATNKADMLFVDPAAAGPYLQNNPGKIKRVETPQPLRAYPVGIGIPANEYRLKRMIDITTEEMHNTGVIEAIIRKHEKYPGSYLRVAPGYVSVPPQPRSAQ